MLEILFTPAGQPYAIALGLMLALVALEIVSTLAGGPASGAVESFMPEGLIQSALEVEAHPGVIGKLLGWLHVGRVPVLMILICFLTVFGLAGWLGIGLVRSLSGWLAPAALSLPLTLLAVLPLTRLCTAGLAAILPRDESSAVQIESFVGATARITLGHARADLAAEARVLDAYGTGHYVRVVPDLPEQTLKQGTEVLLVRHLGESRFAAIAAPPELLNDN